MTIQTQGQPGNNPRPDSGNKLSTQTLLIVCCVLGCLLVGLVAGITIVVFLSDKSEIPTVSEHGQRTEPNKNFGREPEVDPQSERPEIPQRNKPAEEAQRSPEKAETQEVMNDVERLPRLGTWTIYGKDLAGTKWVADLVFTKNLNHRKNAGYIDWYSDTSSGREHFYGTYNPETKRILWKGHRLENAKGPIILGNYEATVSVDGKRLFNGRWYGNGGIPGVWHAEWKAE